MLHKVFFYVERDSFTARASHDGESAYMLLAMLLEHLFPFAGSTTMNEVHARIIIAHRLGLQTGSVFFFFLSLFFLTASVPTEL